MLGAGRTVLGSVREGLDLLPAWARGILKAGEEAVSIVDKVVVSQRTYDGMRHHLPLHEVDSSGVPGRSNFPKHISSVLGARFMAERSERIPHGMGDSRTAARAS